MSGTEDNDSQVSDLSSKGGDDLSSEGSKKEMAKSNEDTKAIRCLNKLRTFVLALLVTSAILAGSLTYIFTSNNEEEDFEILVETQTLEIEEAIHRRSKNLFDLLNTFAVTISSYAETTEDSSWPMETFPNWENVASNYREVTGSRFIASSPYVGQADKVEWEEYSIANQGWIKESYEAMGKDDIDPLDIHEVIYRMDDGHLTEAKSGPFSPLWQLSQPPKRTGTINFDLLSNQAFADTFEVMEGNNEALLSEILNVDMIFGDERSASPESLLLQPIFDDTSVENPILVASLIAVVTWIDFMTDLVRDGNKGMDVVLHNTCEQTYTFSIDGSNATFVGRGDLHQDKFDEFGYDADVVPFSTLDESSHCKFIATIYPTQELKGDERSFLPIIYGVSVAVILLLAAVGFYYYDLMVHRRQKEAIDSAARSNAIVSSLFPADIRNRLFNGNEEDAAAITAKHIDNERIANTPEAQKYRLKNYLDEDGNSDSLKFNEHDDDNVHDASKPIADLFPNTTVLFADIAGFTAWSSVREPSQVFTLLETVYKAFDKTAKRRKVFKVETVGDCYVAVTGLPEPLKDHAIVMCEFARECLSRFGTLVRQLEVALGPDTGDLDIRVGLHSGPVTAGVLRGDKSRFQLFGDTVNTAARIETTGQRGRIHLSHETAELLFEAKKSSWLKKRTETVVAKGKGEMQTYWLITEEELKAGINEEGNKALLPIVKANAPRIAKAAHNVLDPESSLPPKIKRLVDWNVDVLKRLLKQIVAKRNAVAKEIFDLNHPTMMKQEVNIGCDTYVLDEVTEIIRLPGYTHVKLEVSPNKIELPKEVEDQLRLYVASIASMHRDNPFHNFEHASHVMMSVSKLLSRIVAPDEVLNAENLDNKLDMSLHDHTYGITSDPLTQFSVVLAALIHDVDHSGVSNFQLIKEDAKIATVFKNKSVAEQNSIVLAWDRLMESRFCALRSCIYSDPDELKRFRQLMVNTVLATDIFDKELQTLRKNRWDKAFKKFGASQDSSPEDDINRKATIVIEHLIQASDVAHTMQHWHIYQKWNERLFAEMTVAFKSGRMEKDPAEGWYQGELGFLDNYIIPLAKKLKECGVFGVSSDEYLNYALENRREWASKGEEVVEKYVETYNKKEDEGGEAEKGK